MVSWIDINIFLSLQNAGHFVNVNVNVNIISYQLPSKLFREHWLGDFARLLKVQFTSNEGMSDDAPIHECESEINHYTEHYVLYSLRTVCGFFNVRQMFYYMCKGLWDGAYDLSSWKVKPFADVITKAALSPHLFKDPECWSGRDLNLQPPTQQTGAYAIELTGQRFVTWTFWNVLSSHKSAVVLSGRACGLIVISRSCVPLRLGELYNFFSDLSQRH